MASWLKPHLHDTTSCQTGVGCQTGCTTSCCTTGSTTVLNEQPAVSCKQTPVECLYTRYSWLLNRLYNRFDNRVERTAWTNSCSFNQLSNWDVKPVWKTPVYRIQPVVKPEPAECLYTRYNRLSNRFDNRLYHVNGALDITFIFAIMQNGV